MARLVREVRKRGAFGWIFLLLFYCVSAWFAWALLKGMVNVAPLLNDHTMSKAEQTGATIGTVLGFGSILAMWAFAAVITGLLALLTRGKRILIEDGPPRLDEQRHIEAEREKWRALSSEPPPLPQLQPQQRDLVGPIVIGCIVVIACVATISWLYAPRHTQTTATMKTTSSIPKPQSTVMEGLTPEQIELLNAKRDAMALPVAEPPPKKKKWAQ